MRKNRKKVLIAGCLVLLLLFIVVYFLRAEIPVYHLEVVKAKEKQGYGYKICRGKRVIINQPFVPALPYNRTFSTAEDAEKVGQLVLDRIRNGEDFSVKEEDLIFCLPSLN